MNFFSTPKKYANTNFIIILLLKELISFYYFYLTKKIYQILFCLLIFQFGFRTQITTKRIFARHCVQVGTVHTNDGWSG
jgi:hypothetical protein